jgi:DNA mismatch repair protein MutL
MHAGHERVLYEKFKAESAASGLASQHLLEPLVIEVKEHELGRLLEERAQWESAGFDVDALGPTRLALRRVPAVLNVREVRKVVGALIADLALDVRTHHLEGATDRFLGICPSSMLRFSAVGRSMKALPVDLLASPRPAGLTKPKGRTLY